MSTSRAGRANSRGRSLAALGLWHCNIWLMTRHDLTRHAGAAPEFWGIWPTQFPRPGRATAQRRRRAAQALMRPCPGVGLRRRRRSAACLPTRGKMRSCRMFARGEEGRHWAVSTANAERAGEAPSRTLRRALLANPGFPSGLSSALPCRMCRSKSREMISALLPPHL